MVAEAVKDSRETLAELRFSARASVSASPVDPRLRVSTNHNPRNEDPQRSSLVRTRLCLTVGSHSKRVPVPHFTTQTVQKPPMGEYRAPEVVAEAVKDSRETLAELRFSARASVSASQ